MNKREYLANLQSLSNKSKINEFSITDAIANIQGKLEDDANKAQIDFLAEKQLDFDPPDSLKREKPKEEDRSYDSIENIRAGEGFGANTQKVYDPDGMIQYGDSVNADFKAGKIDQKTASARIRDAGKQIKARNNDRLTTNIIKDGEVAADRAVDVTSTALSLLPGGVGPAALLQVGKAASHARREYDTGLLPSITNPNNIRGYAGEQDADYNTNGMASSAVQAGGLGVFAGAAKAAPIIASTPVGKAVVDIAKSAVQKSPAVRVAKDVADKIAPSGSLARRGVAAAGSNFDPTAAAGGGVVAQETWVNPDDSILTGLGKIGTGMVVGGVGLPTILNGMKSGVNAIRDIGTSSGRQIGRALAQEVETGPKPDIRNVPAPSRRAAGFQDGSNFRSFPKPKEDPIGFFQKIKKGFTPQEPTSKQMEFPRIFDPSTGTSTSQYGLNPPLEVNPANPNLPTRRVGTQDLGVPTYSANSAPSSGEAGSREQIIRKIKPEPELEAKPKPKLLEKFVGTLVKGVGRGIARETSKQVARGIAGEAGVAARRVLTPSATELAAETSKQVARSISLEREKPFSFYPDITDQPAAAPLASVPIAPPKVVPTTPAPAPAPTPAPAMSPVTSVPVPVPVPVTTPASVPVVIPATATATAPQPAQPAPATGTATAPGPGPATQTKTPPPNKKKPPELPPNRAAINGPFNKFSGQQFGFERTIFNNASGVVGNHSWDNYLTNIDTSPTPRTRPQPQYENFNMKKTIKDKIKAKLNSAKNIGKDGY